MQRPRADRRRLDQAAHDAAPEKHCRDEHRVADLECGTRRLVDAGVHRPVAVRDVGSECFSALTGSGGQWRSRGRGGGVVQLLKRSTSGGELDSRAGRTHTPHTARGKTVGEWVSDASDRAATGASCDLRARIVSTGCRGEMKVAWCIAIAGPGPACYGTGVLGYLLTTAAMGAREVPWGRDCPS